MPIVTVRDRSLRLDGHHPARFESHHQVRLVTPIVV
jgi:hypothetical protein